MGDRLQQGREARQYVGVSFDHFIFSCVEHVEHVVWGFRVMGTDGVTSRSSQGIPHHVHQAHNDVLFERTGLVDLGLTLRYQRLRFLGHLGRMAAERWPRILLVASEVPGFDRPVGRPALTWPKVAETDLQAANIQGWLQKCRNRELWRDEIRIK